MSICVSKKYAKNSVINLSSRQHHWPRFSGFIVNFEHISHLCSSVSLINFEQVTAGWVLPYNIALQPSLLLKQQLDIIP